MYRAVAFLRNEADDVQVEFADVSFFDLAEGKKWIDGDEGDLFAESFNYEMKTGGDYEGYWLDEILVC